MGIYAIDAATPAWEKMVKLLTSFLKPFNLKKLILLATIIIFSKHPLRSISSTNSSRNHEANAYSPTDIDGTYIQAITNILGPLGFIIILPISIIILLINYISNVFSFMFIETLISGEPEIKKGFKKNKYLGFSTFMFDIAFSLIFIGGTVIISLPFIITYLNTGSFAFITENPANTWLIYGIVAILAVIALILIISAIMTLTYDFIMPKMFSKKMGVKECWRRMFPILKKEWLQTIGYLVIRQIFGIISGILAIFLLIIPIITIILIAAILGIMGYLIGLFTAIGTTASILIIIPFTIAFIIFSIYIIVIFMLPISIFFRYHSMETLKSFDKNYRY